MGERNPLLDNVTLWYRRFCTSLGIIAGLTIVLMIFSTTIDTTLRYIFSRPIRGIFELNEVILVVCVFMGLGWTQIHRGHIRVILILRRLPPRSLVVIDMVIWILCLIFIMVLGIQSGKEALHSFDIKEYRWGSVQMPIWWAKALVPIGFWTMCFQLVIDIWTDIYRLVGFLPLELPDVADQGTEAT